MQGSISVFTNKEPRQWLDDWQKQNPDKKITGFDYTKGMGKDGSSSVELMWELNENGGVG